MKNKLIFWLIPSLVIILAGAFWYFNRCFSSFSPAIIPNHSAQAESESVNKKDPLPLVEPEVSLLAVGDISFSRGVERTIKKENDINYPFLSISDYLNQADIVFGNLETPISKGREIKTGEMIFRSNPGMEKALKTAGFSIFSLANNHTPNFGQLGLQDTFKYLQSADLKYVGAGLNSQEANSPVYLEKDGLKFAFLAYNNNDVVPSSYEAGATRAGTAFMKIDKMTAAIKTAKQQADFVIVSMHSGIEYVPSPNQVQISFAHAAIDAGTDLVIGHHPHVVQSMEQYQGKYILYSLGNFVFDQSWSKETTEGLIAKIFFTKEGVKNISFLPVVMKNFAQPEPVEGAEAQKILRRLKFPQLENSIIE